MATRLTFIEFDSKLKHGTLTDAEYERYLEPDPTVNVPRLRFKADALADLPPPGYDVDEEVYLAQRAAEGRERAKEKKPKLKKVTAEGDSWFNLPPVFWPTAIADRLKSNRRVDVDNIAKWGDTLAEILAKNEYMSAIEKFGPDWFILSAGGNDVQEALAAGRLIIRYDATVPIEQCFSPSGLQVLATIGNGYRRILNQVSVRFSTLPTIVYAYDFPRPTVGKGKYIGQYLEGHGYPRSTWDSVAKALIDRLTDTVKPIAESFPNVCFLDCRKITEKHPWHDDMHPKSDGFTALAAAFEKQLGVAARLAAARTGRAVKGSTRGAASRDKKRRKAASSRGAKRGAEASHTNKFMINVDLETKNLYGGRPECDSEMHRRLGRHFDVTVHSIACGSRNSRSAHRPPTRYWDDKKGEGYTLPEVIALIHEIREQHSNAHARRCLLCDVGAHRPEWD
jgi:hypothetical protein